MNQVCYLQQYQRMVSEHCEGEEEFFFVPVASCRVPLLIVLRLINQ